MGRIEKRPQRHVAHSWGIGNDLKSWRFGIRRRGPPPLDRVTLATHLARQVISPVSYRHMLFFLFRHLIAAAHRRLSLRFVIVAPHKNLVASQSDQEKPTN
jgi:hypothetical protein